MKRRSKPNAVLPGTQLSFTRMHLTVRKLTLCRTDAWLDFFEINVEKFSNLRCFFSTSLAS